MRRSPSCVCEWPVRCDHSGVIACEGCGGDICGCVCGGEQVCHGCDDCAGPQDVEGEVQS